MKEASSKTSKKDMQNSTMHQGNTMKETLRGVRV